MQVGSSYHLSYCTNVHPGENWILTFENLKRYVPSIKERVSPTAAFGVGLCLSNKASEELAAGDAMQVFQRWLKDEGLYVFTMNGFPYGNFHAQQVKDQVHSPDWSSAERLTYTMRLFEQLAILLPTGVSGGISTSPISYKHWHSSSDEVFQQAAKNLSAIVKQLVELERSTGKFLHLDIEPEPDGLVENSEELVRFFEDYLVPIAVQTLAPQLAKSSAEITDLVYRHINICYDICHFALAYEEPRETFKRLKEAKIKVGKIQVSSALKILHDEQNKEAIWERLALFNEPTYLHQVTEQTAAGVKTYADLPELLKEKRDFSELRAHFHVPIFLASFAPLFSTQDQILKVLAYLKTEELCEHLEVETYTWNVLPKELKTELSASIVRELIWLHERL